jgi:hypothetical protein
MRKFTVVAWVLVFVAACSPGVSVPPNAGMDTAESVAVVEATSSATDALYPAVSPTSSAVDLTASAPLELTIQPTPRPTVRSTISTTAQPVVSVTAEWTIQPTSQPTVLLTALPVASPTVEPTALPTTPPPSAGPAVWEQDITLNTYGWQGALIPTEPNDPAYPYPRMNFDAVTGPAPRVYRAVFIQNAYVQLIVVPELGGRVLRWTDRVTGRQLLYANPVIKPTRWGYRGWWLATGGIEWAFPTEEHGLNEYRPWQYELLWNGVRVWDTDDRTGMGIEVTIRLDGAHNSFALVPRITNLTAQPHAYQFWANAMLTLSDDNVPSPDLTFVLPDDAVTVHATGDGSLPGPGGQMAWPVYGGRDFSRYSEWHKYLGIFAHPAQAGFVGAYDLGNDQGIVRVFPHTIATGVKFFCLGDLSSSLWTEDGSRYFELWAGLTPTFWDNWTLQPGANVTWTEHWYPVSGIGGYNWANAEAAIHLLPSGEEAAVAVATSRALNGTVVLRRSGGDVQQWDVSIAPGRPFRASGGPAPGGGDWGVQVLEGGTVVAQMGP